MTTSNQLKIPGANPMVLGAPWVDSYLQRHQKERFSVMFIYQLLLRFICVLLLIQLINQMSITMNLSNLGWFHWFQSMYTLQQVKYLVIHQKMARD